MNGRVLLLAALGLCGCSPVLVWHGHTPDRARRVEVVERGKQQFVRIDGVEGPKFDAVPAATLAFSADGKHVAYAAKQAAHWMVVAKQTRGRQWQGIGQLVLSADGEHVAYAALSGKKWRVVHDGQPGPLLDSIFDGTLRFSPDGRRLAYVAELEGKSRAVIDGQLGPALEAIGQLGFSPDGAHVAYLARDEQAAWLVRDGVGGPRYDTVRELVQGHHGRIAHVARRGVERFAVIDGLEQPPHQRVEGLTFSADGSRVAYLARDEARSRVIVDGAAEAELEEVDASSLAFSPDGRHLAYVARRGKQRQVVRDGVEGPPFTRIAGLQQAAGDRWGYLGWDEHGAWPVIDGQRRAKEQWAADLALSPDGRRFAFLRRGASGFEVVHDAGRERFELVVDGSLAFGADGRRWGCLAGDRARKKLFIAIEGAAPVPFDLDELAGLVADRPADAELIRRWVRAEVQRAR